MKHIRSVSVEPLADTILSSLLPVLHRTASQVIHRLHHRREILVLAAPTLDEAPAERQTIEETAFIRLTRTDREHLDMALAAMRGARMSGREVLDRLERGDRFYGWLNETGVCSFVWTCHGDRVIGARRYLWERRRAFLYDFHTRPADRSRGLFRALLLHLRHALWQEGIEQLAIDVQAGDLASVRGILSAGFKPIERLTVDTWLKRWQVVQDRSSLSPLTR